METIEVKIMLLVGSNGKATACVHDHLGWGDLQDNIMDWDGNKSIDPDNADRYFVTVHVRKPSVSVIEASAIEVAP